MEKVRVLEVTALKKRSAAACGKSRKGSAMGKVFRMPNVPNRESRAEAILADEDHFPLPGFILQRPPRRYLVIEMDEFGEPLGAYQAGTLPEIAKLLESTADTTEARIVEIHDLDTGDTLRPDYERIYRVPRIYRGRFIAYQAPPDDDRG